MARVVANERALGKPLPRVMKDMKAMKASGVMKDMKAMKATKAMKAPERLKSVNERTYFVTSQIFGCVVSFPSQALSRVRKYHSGAQHGKKHDSSAHKPGSRRGFNQKVDLSTIPDFNPTVGQRFVVVKVGPKEYAAVAVRVPRLRPLSMP